MILISLCMIVKNEERFLPKCLESVKGLADEMIIVDTGSTDRTVEIAEKAGAKVLHYKWDSDTAKARNTGLKEAKGEWILVLDADEALTPREHESIRKLVHKDFDAYYLVQLNYTNEIGHLQFRPLLRKTEASMDFKGYFPVEIIRFFRNGKGIEFRSIVHERLNESVKELGLKAARTDVPVHHYQMLKGEEEMKRKQLAFLELFEKKVKEYPDDPKLYFDMGTIYYNYKKDQAKAIECFEKASSLKPKYIDPLFSLATIHMRNNDNKRAEEMFKRILEINSRNAAAHYNLGNVYVRQRRLMDAARSYGEAIKINPTMMQAYNNLGNILVIGRKYDEAIKAYNLAVKMGHPKKEQLLKKIEQLEKVHNENNSFIMKNNKKPEKGNIMTELLKECWENCRADLFPKDRRMKILEDKEVDGMSTENIRFLINEIVRRFAPTGVYLEVGIYRGCSLLSAALFNPSARCIGIDNFSQFDGVSIKDFKKDGIKNEEALKNNLSKFGNPENVQFYNMDYKECIKKIFSENPNLKVDVYFYDGEHSYENQYEGLKIMLPHLAEKCIVIVDDINWEGPEKAAEDFIKDCPEFKSSFKIKTKAEKGAGTPDWWNGFQVIARGI